MGATILSFNGGGIGDDGAAMVDSDGGGLRQCCDNGDGIGDGGATTEMMICRWWNWRRRGCYGDGGLPLVVCDGGLRRWWAATMMIGLATAGLRRR
ncbi:hypothetical protein TIFTF001_048127 [Ficus carica]|uniref:Uncharacterized protein n=1 Tax=Ficus carica TaxID=3494 RepID=A0AA88CVF7_FICCA|nr:hypothetical protein TIFTF001_048127 [Ficus carica]